MGARYTADDIQVLSGLGAVRKRPGMYVGDTSDGSGLHHLVWEVVGNVIDLHLRRDATELHVELSGDSWMAVRDDGPGIPVAILPHTKLSALEAIFTQLHAGATYDGHFPHVHVTRGMTGIGLAAVNALSSALVVETTYERTRWTQSYERGVPTSELRCLGQTSIEGTTVRFRADPEVFDSIDFDRAQIAEQLQSIAWLNPLLRVFFDERRLSGRGGLRTWVRTLAAARGEIAAQLSTCRTVDDVYVDLAVVWTPSTETSIRCFVNMVETKTGTHVDGIWQGLADVARVSAAEARAAFEVGLTAIVHVGLFSPVFGGPQRVHLTSPIAGTAVANVLSTALQETVGRDLELRRFVSTRLGISSEP